MRPDISTAVQSHKTRERTAIESRKACDRTAVESHVLRDFTVVRLRVLRNWMYQKSLQTLNSRHFSLGYRNRTYNILWKSS